VKECNTGQYLRELLGRRSGGAGRRAGGTQEKGKRQAAE
jgi:hypothetical protein